MTIEEKIETKKARIESLSKKIKQDTALLNRLKQELLQLENKQVRTIMDELQLSPADIVAKLQEIAAQSEQKEA